MEGITAKKNKREGLLERMDSFLSEAVVPSAADPTEPEETELPFESLDDYSTDPIGFEEIADMVCTKVKAFFSLSVKYNHRSSKYLEACGFLERGIKYLGSCCLTGVLLKKKGHELPKLEDLSTHWLYGMVSFNIRKLNRTVDEELATAGTIPSRWLDMQFRYINLAERLKSTEAKIYEYTTSSWRSGEKYVEHALMFSEKAWNRYYVKKYVRKPDFRKSPAFPVLKEVSASGNQESEKCGERKAESEIKVSDAGRPDAADTPHSSFVLPHSSDP